MLSALNEKLTVNNGNWLWRYVLIQERDKHEPGRCRGGSEVKCVDPQFIRL
ncbi:hypothetical protein [Gimesia algae]|uniref:Uncharacterized protein n=1 Tax=Gimesia algae TaxID=2527971 RepID=A0A517VL20_9PLAN|nr:hypothetical protein [Gimesia algae]QDT93713.1 hypothetical protein Pan161_53960 [Gimesia algae]